MLDLLKMEVYILDMRDFNVILGVEWLSKNHATIHYFKKEIVFQALGEEEFRLPMTKSRLYPALCLYYKHEGSYNQKVA